MKNIAFICSGNDEGLPSLEHDREAIYRKLSASSKWHTPIYNNSLATFSNFIDELNKFKDENVEDFFFYYTGHGQREGVLTKKLFVEFTNEKPRNLEDFITYIFKILKPNRIALILDACYSATAIQTVEYTLNCSFEIISSSGEVEKSDSVSSSNLSLFTEYFIKALDELEYDYKKITLEAIKNSQTFKSYPKDFKYAYPATEYGMMEIATPRGEKRHLESVQNNLKKIIDLDTLRLYANNLLSTYFKSVNLSNMDYDKIVEHLYDLRQPLLCLLHNINADILYQDLQCLRLEFSEYSTAKCCTFEEMEYKELNLLLTFEIPDDDISRTKVTFWEYKEPHAIEKKDLEVDLTNNNNPIDLVDAIFDLVNISQENVLLEFIMPYELIDIDITSWTKSYDESLVETFRVVRRIAERIERYRDDECKLKSWEDFWGYYKQSKDTKLHLTKLPSDKKIRYTYFKETPYIRFDEKITINEYKKLINTTASIVLSPNKKTTKQLDEYCSDMQDIPLGNLVEKSFESFCDLPHILIWDNPSRQIPIIKENRGE